MVASRAGFASSQHVVGLTGLPAEAGTYVFTVEVRDGLRVKDSETFRIVVAKAHGEAGDAVQLADRSFSRQ